METAVIPADRIFGTDWTPAQLQAIAERYEFIQSHTLYSSTAVRVAPKTQVIDRAALRALVARTMGRVEGTYWMVAAMTMAHLAISFPQLLTEEQVCLLLDPIAAGESLAQAGRVHQVTALAA